MTSKLRFWNFVIENKNMIMIILIGFFLRFMIMPFTIHHDLLCTAWRTALYSFEGIFKIPYFAELNYAFFVNLLKPLLNMLPADLAMSVHNTFSVAPNQVAYATFLSSKEIFRYLFLLKSPYILLDLVLLAIILKYFKGQSLMLLFWAINPFILYSSYMWGRYELFPIIFAMLSWIYAAKSSKNAALISVLMMGIAISYRISFVIFLPVLLIFLSKNTRQYIWFTLVGVLPNIFFGKLVGLFGGGRSIDEYVELLFDGKISSGYTAISLFLVAFFSVLYFAYREKSRNALDYKKFIFFSGMSIFSFYAFSLFYPQYSAWLTPVALMFIYLEKRTFWLFLLLFVVFFLLVDSYFGCYTSVCLVAEAINPTFANAFYSINTQLIDKALTDEIMYGIYHTFFILSLAGIGITMKRKVYETK